MSESDSTKASSRYPIPERRTNRARERLAARGSAALLVALSFGSAAPARGAAPDPSASGGGASARRAPLPGQMSSTFGIDEVRPEDSVPNAKDRDRNPLEYG